MPRVLRTPEAEESRVEAWLQVGESSVHGADRLLERIDGKCGLYATQPQAGAPRPDLGENVRCFAVDHHVVIYRPLDDGILVLLVVHGARDIPAVFRDVFGASPP